MKKSTRSILCALLSVLMLLSIFTVPLSAASRTAIERVVASSDLEKVAVLYGRSKTLQFEITEGEPIYFNQSWATCWETYNEETKKWENFSGRFVPGKYRVYAQLRIDGEDAKAFELDESLTCTVDGQTWTVELVSNHYDYCTAIATSPEIVIVDDPSVVAPIDIENVYFDLKGYVAGKKFSECEMIAHLGSESMIEIVEGPMFFELVDSNENGIADVLESEAAPAEDIRADADYMLFFTFRAKEGYDLFDLKPQNIHLPIRKKGVMYDMLSVYNKELDLYSALLILNRCVEQVSFTQSPKDTVGYYAYWEDSGVEINWETDGVVSKYQIYKWDEEDKWDVMPYTNVFSTSYILPYADGSTAGRYRIEAILNGEVVAVSQELTVTWQEKQPVTLPIRIDVSGAVGSHKPVDLTEYYPESEQYSFADESFVPVNQWCDAKTSIPVEHFEHGKQYFYVIGIIPAYGYYLDVDAVMIKGEEPYVPDAIRAYGIGWDMVTNFTVYDENIYLSGFFFTYDEAIGIPAESDKLIYELVFDARELVGSDSIPNIPEELFAHEGLTLCGINCDCDTVPDNAKEIINVCMNNSTHSPADAFIPETPFVYELIFHVNDGWEIPSFLNNFDFVLSDTPFETINIVYVRELNVISVRLGVFCGDDGKIEAGEHTCVKQRMDELAPTCTENGRIAHFACYCGKAYADRWGFQEIGDSEDVTLNALGHSFGNEWLSDADNHWKACDCGEIAQKGTHSDANGNGSCDICGIRLNSVGEDTETEETDGGAVDYESESNGEDKDETGDIGIADEGPLGVGAIIGIVVGSAVILGIGVFAVIWFAVKKKSFADLIRKK